MFPLVLSPEGVVVFGGRVGRNMTSNNRAVEHQYIQRDFFLLIIILLIRKNMELDSLEITTLFFIIHTQY